MKNSVVLIVLFFLGLAVNSQCVVNLGKNDNLDFTAACGSSNPYVGDVTVNFTQQPATFNFNSDLIINGTVTFNPLNNSFVNVNANLTINGNLEVISNNLELSVPSPNVLTVNGDVDNNGNNAQYTVDGEFNIDGNFQNGGNNTQLYETGDFVADSITGNASGFECVGDSGVGDCDINFTVPGGCEPPTSDFCTDVGVALPVVLTSFNTDVDLHAIQVFWSTSTELNCRYFEIISQTAEGEIIGTYQTPCKGAGDYELSVARSQVAYISLAQYDNDGTKNFSKTLPVALLNTNHPRFYPNPCHGLLHITASHLVNIQLYRLDGEVQPFTTISKSSEEQLIDIPSKGLYLLEFQTSNQSFKEKIIVH